MSLSGTATELLETIRLDARIADDDPSATDAILLAEATRILHRTYTPAVRKCRAEYYIATARVALVSGRVAYPIPRRATTSTVRRIRVLDSSGVPVAQLSPSSLEDFGHASGPVPVAYAVTDSAIVVYPTPNAATHTLEILFEYRPSQLVPVASAFAATYSYTTATKVHTLLCALDPSVAVGDLFDVVSMNPPFSAPLIDAVAATVTGGDLQITTSAYMGRQEDLGFSSTVAGVYVCHAGESPIPQIPIELHPCLAMHTAAKFLTPIDPQGAADLRSQADTDMVAVLEAMTPRQQGTQQRMRPRVRHIRTGGYGGGYRRSGGTFGDLS